MPDDPICCLSCVIQNGDSEKLKNWLDIYVLSESQALFLGNDLLTKAMESGVDRVRKFLLEGGAKAYGKGENKSETPLYWNGAPLCQAVGTDSIEIIKVLLQEKYVIAEPTSRDYLAPLHMAAQLDNTGIAQVLLNHLDQHETPPCCAIVMNNLQTVKSLLQASVDVNKRFCTNSIEFSMAFQLARDQISKAFLNRFSFNEPPLYTAAKVNNTESIQRLLQINANVEERSYNYLTPLHIAAQLRNTESAKILLDFGADINSVCASALDTLLIAAVSDNKETLVELLLKKGVNGNTMMHDRSTLLHLAANLPDLKVAKLLLNNGFDFDARDKYNENLCHAIKTFDVETIESIIKERSNPENPMCETQSKIFEDLLRYGFGFSFDSTNEEYLNVAIVNGCSQIVEYLLKLGTDINNKCEEKSGTSPLHWALAYKRFEIAKLLIKNNADVNGKDENGVTPLHCACDRMYVDFVDEEWETPMHSTAKNETGEIIKILLNEGATVNTKQNDGKTPLYLAAHSGHATAVKILIENGGNVTDRDNDGNTPLHIAAVGYSSKTVEILLNSFDDVDCRGGGGKTALDIAAECRKFRIVPLLLDHNADINRLSNYFKVYSKTLHRTRYYSDSDSSDDNKTMRRADRVAIILKHHIVKLIALNRWVSDKNLQAINLFGDYKQFHDQCKSEVEFMRQKKIGVSDVSYYDILTKDMDELEHFVRNKDIVDGLKTGDHKHMFHLYSVMLHNRFKRGQKIAGLLDTSTTSV